MALTYPTGVAPSACGRKLDVRRAAASFTTLFWAPADDVAFGAPKVQINAMLKGAELKAIMVVPTVTFTSSSSAMT
jgi:hypothetical protein